EAIQTYRDLIDAAPEDDPALDALTELYLETKKNDDLAELYERRAETNSDPNRAAGFRLLLAKLLGGELGNRDRAFEQLETIVIAMPSHAGAATELEGMLDDDEHKERVIEVLRNIYEQNDAWKKTIALSEHRL